MRLNLSEKWYAREFCKDAEESAVSVAAGRSNIQTPPEEEPAAQKDNKRVYEAAPPLKSLPPNNTP